jgi:hypothetical protein
VIDLNAFGGNAQLTVKEVNKEGFIVAISKKSSAFKGFYYVANIVAPSLYTDEEQVAASNAESLNPAVAAADAKATEDAKKIYKELLHKTDILIKKSGRDFSNIKNLKPEEISKEKLAIAESWKNADPKTFNERLALAIKLDDMLRANPNIRLFEF